MEKNEKVQFLVLFVHSDIKLHLSSETTGPILNFARSLRKGGKEALCIWSRSHGKDGS